MLHHTRIAHSQIGVMAMDMHQVDLFGPVRVSEFESAESEFKRQARAIEEEERKKEEDRRRHEEERLIREQQDYEFAKYLSTQEESERPGRKHNFSPGSGKRKSGGRGRGALMRETKLDDYIPISPPQRGRGRLTKEEKSQAPFFRREAQVREDIQLTTGGEYAHSNSLVRQYWQGSQSEENAEAEEDSVYSNKFQLAYWQGEDPHSENSSVYDYGQFEDVAYPSTSEYSSSSPLMLNTESFPLPSTSSSSAPSPALPSPADTPAPPPTPPQTSQSTQAQAVRQPRKSRLACNFSNAMVNDKDNAVKKVPPEQNITNYGTVKLDEKDLRTTSPTRPLSFGTRRKISDGLTFNDFAPRSLASSLLKPADFMSYSTDPDMFVYKKEEFPPL